MSICRFYQRMCAGVILLFVIFNLVSLNYRPSTIHAQDLTSQIIESNDSSVIQVGEWQTQNAAKASGGDYLYSSGAEDDALTLDFTGTSLEVIYVAGPKLGTFILEVDGAILHTVSTTVVSSGANQTAYDQSQAVTDLNNEPHTLKIYPQAEGDIIAIDAFVITAASGVVTIADDEGQGGVQASACAPVNATHLISQRVGGQHGNGASGAAEVSGNGRFVVFESDATNLIVGDNNGQRDIFVYDRQLCITSLVSVRTNGSLANGSSFNPSISADGRFVAFESNASNLVTGDANGVFDIFVYDRQTNTTVRASVNSGGAEANGFSTTPAISADGHFVAFTSAATNLGANDTNATPDVFVRNLVEQTTLRVSLGTGGVQAEFGGFAPAISADGSFIAFASTSTNLVAGDTNGNPDIFVRNRLMGTTTRVSVASGGGQATGGGSGFPAISADGRFVAFASAATNLVAGDTNGGDDEFVHDRQTNTTTRVSVISGGGQAANGGFSAPSISADGRYVAFHSVAPNLVTGDTNGLPDVFVHDRTANTTTRVSLASNGNQATGGNSSNAAISGDGSLIVFQSGATNLVTGDTNAQVDIFGTAVAQPAADTLALFNPTFKTLGVFNTLVDNPSPDQYTIFSAYAPTTGGQWVMGDWNGDGLKTPGVYANGPFYYTNKSGESAPSDWSSLWIGIAGPPVSGRFNGALANDCIGAVQQANSGGQSVFVLYYTCTLNGTATPTISNQWLSAVLPDSGGFTGAHQFGAGDFDGDRVDSIAVRRGPYIAFGNVAPVTGPATFNFAQYIGAPVTTDYGIFVVGNWDRDGFDSFGLFYQIGEFFYRNDLLFNSGAYGNQSVGVPFAGPIQATTWR